MSLDNCKLITLPKIVDRRGNLTVVESQRHAHFTIKRVYYLYDVPAGAERGGHAHKDLEQLIIALSGSFDVHLDDGYKTTRYTLNRPNNALYVCRMIWRSIDNFSAGSVCLVLASTYYEESDYYRDYDEFVRSIREIQ